MSAFLKTLQNTAHRFDLWKRGDKILVAVSGGPDSACLLDALFELAKKHDWALHVAHVNYRLREADSDADEALVRERAHAYALPISVLRPKVPKKTPNLEAHLRAIRYTFFEKLRKKHGLDTIAVAHTEDDQAETLLLRLIRGAGLRGLGAMRPKAGAVIRPLLLTPKADILRYLREKNLPFRTDTSNADSRFTRNRIRHELLPLLESFNPHIRETLSRTALTLADDAETLATLLAHNPTFTHKQKTDESSFTASVFTTESPAIQRALLRHIVNTFDPSAQPPPFDEIEEMRKIIGSTKNKTAQKTFRGLKFTRRGDKVSMLSHKKDPNAKPLPVNNSLSPS